MGQIMADCMVQGRVQLQYIGQWCLPYTKCTQTLAALITDVMAMA